MELEKDEQFKFRIIALEKLNTYHIFELRI